MNFQLSISVEIGPKTLSHIERFITNVGATIIMSQSEIAQGLVALKSQTDKIAAESTATLEKLAKVEEQLANQTDVSPELQAAFDDLKSSVQKADDLVQDLPASIPTN